MYSDSDIAQYVTQNLTTNGKLLDRHKTYSTLVQLQAAPFVGRIRLELLPADRILGEVGDLM